MAEKNDNNSSSRSSNDISEMLRLLRESVEADRRAQSEEKKDSEIEVADEEIKASLEKVFEETSLDTDLSDDEEDVIEDEEESSWFAFEDDEDESDDEEDANIENDLEKDEAEQVSEETLVEDKPVEDEEAPADEGTTDDELPEEDPDDDDPWYSGEESKEELADDEEEDTTDDELPEEDPYDDDPWYSEEESKEEPTDDEEEDTTEDELPEEDPDDNDPWYSEEESKEEPSGDEEEDTTEDELPEEDPDDDDPWYSEEESEEESADDEKEDSTKDELPEEYETFATPEPTIEIAPSGDSGWYVVTPETDEDGETPETSERDEVALDDESIWYNAEEDSETDEEDEEELYQDEEFDEDDEYDEDFDEEESSEDEETPKDPENDYSEEDIYIYDAEKSEEDDYLYETSEEKEGENAPDSSDEEENAIDETDIGLLSTLGLASDEDEVSPVRKSASDEAYAGDISYDYDGGEYVLENQRHEISAGYRNEKKRTLMRLIVCGGVTLFLLIYEILSALGVNMPGMLNYDECPLSHVMISLQGLVICALISAKQLYIGVSDLIDRKATPYSVSAVTVAVNLLYSIVVAIASPEGFGIFNFVGAFSVLAAVTYEYVLLISEEHIFGVFSTKKGQKYAFVTEDASGETAGDGEISLCAYATDFNKNYFLRMRKRSEDYKYLTYLILSVLAASLLTFIVSLICKTGWAIAMKNGVMAVNYALPIGVLGAFSYPIFRASVKALGNRGAFVGGSAIDEYSKTRFVTFGEEELFTSLKTTHLDLKPSGNNNVSDVLCKTSMLLAEIGGPMKRMVEMMQSDFVGSKVEIDEIFDDGISARTEGVVMLAGSDRFLKQHGVAVNTTTDFKDVDENNEILYISIDGKLAARYYLKYKADTEFIKLVNALGARGISVGIRTRNPGINSDIIARRCPELKYKVYTIKTPAKDENEQNLSRATTDSGLVAAGKALSLAYPLLACRDIKTYYKIDMFIRIISAALGVTGVVLNAIMANSADLNVLSVLLYQSFWFLPTILFGIFHFKHRSKKKKFKIVYR